MRTKEVPSIEELRRLMSELVSLRDQVEQAERDRTASQIKLSLVIAVAQGKRPISAVCQSRSK